jgi:hypothetical protein
VDKELKIAPAQVWYDGRNQGSSGDTSTHPERIYASPIYITDSAGKPIRIVTGTGQLLQEHIEITKTKAGKLHVVVSVKEFDKTRELYDQSRKASGIA